MKKAFWNKHVIVTGAASGIGLATAESFLKEGATVFGFDKDGEGLSEIRGIHSFTSDMEDHQTLETHVASILSRYRKIDVLVNCAGMSYYKRHMESTLAEWRKTMGINLEGYYRLVQLVVPSMVKHGGGRIVNVASTQAIASEESVGAYAASKGGIISWSRTLAVDLAEYGILVNSVSPGCIKTPMSIVNGIDETETEEFKAWYIKKRKIPLARPGNPLEVAKAILFLSGEDCTYITGHNLVVDGGLTITF